MYITHKIKLFFLNKRPSMFNYNNPWIYYRPFLFDMINHFDFDCDKCHGYTPYVYPQLIVPYTLQKCMLDVYCDILANLD